MTLFELIWDVLSLNRAPFEALLARPGRLRLALGVVFSAGLSRTLGQSFVLFANSVKRRRFIISLVVGAALYVFGFLFLVSSIWLVAHYGLRLEQSLARVVAAVGVAYAPYLFSFFMLTPYFGSFFGVVLSVWNLAAILVALSVTLGTGLMEALVCSALGWLLLQVAERTLGRPLQALRLTLRQLAAGKRLELGRAQLQDLIRRGRK